MKSRDKGEPRGRFNRWAGGLAAGRGQNFFAGSLSTRNSCQHRISSRAAASLPALSKRRGNAAGGRRNGRKAQNKVQGNGDAGKRRGTGLLGCAGEEKCERRRAVLGGVQKRRLPVKCPATTLHRDLCLLNGPLFLPVSSPTIIFPKHRFLTSTAFRFLPRSAKFMRDVPFLAEVEHELNA